MSHPRVRGRLRLLLGLLLVTACAAENGERGRTPASEETSSGEAGPDRAVCLEGEPFVASGAIPVTDLDQRTSHDPASDPPKRELSALRWERHVGCERFVVDLGSEGTPAATPGAVRAEMLRDLGVVRLHLRDVETVASDATDARFDGPLAGAAYAVSSPEGRWIYVDLHLERAAEARVLGLRDPARVVVDLRPGGATLPTPPARGQRVVILEPRTGSSTFPLTVTGYARTFEANVVARVVQEGEVVRDTFTTATAWADAWGHYSMTIPDGPSGAMELQVGEHSARDGTWEGVSADLDVQ